MQPDDGDRDGSIEHDRADLSARVRARQSDLEMAALARVRDLGEQLGNRDADYEAGVRAAVSEALECALLSIEQGDDSSGPMLPAAAAHARRAARDDMRLDVVMRCCAAVERCLREVVMDEADHLPGPFLRDAIRGLGWQADRLMDAIASEYHNEVERLRRSPDQRRARLVQRLLSGKAADTRPLKYDFAGAWHLCIIATGPEAEAAVHGLFKAGLGHQLLPIPRGEQSVSGWLASHRRPATGDIERVALAHLPDGVSLAIGEPAQGLEGFRFTHRQADATRRVALRRPQQITQFAAVAVEAVLLLEEELSRSVLDIWLSPLDGDRDRGAVLRKTLRAYISTGCNAKSAGSQVGLHRDTVEEHLKDIEDKLGRPVRTCLAELELALRLEALGVVA